MLIVSLAMTSIIPNVYSASTTVYVDPAMVTASVGETFTVEIKISGAVDVFSWQFRLEWNATVLDFVSVEEGDFLEDQPQGTFFFNVTEQDNIGTDYIVAIATTNGDWPGVSGLGTLATVTFQVEDIGETPLHFHNPYPAEPTDTFLLESNLAHIDFTAEDGLFTNVAGLPVPSFTHSPSIPKIGENITFDASASDDPDGYIVSYFWDFGDDTTADVTDPITYHAYDEAGDYTVALTVTDNASLTGTLSKSLRVRYPHDVAVTSVSASLTEVTAGETVSITVTVLNDGTETETFTVTAYYNGNEVASAQTVTNLAANETQTLTFSWSTAGVNPKDYKIKATASTVSGETYTNNNIYVDGTVTVKAASQEFPVLYWGIGGIIAIGIVGFLVFFFMRRRKS